MSMYHSKVKYVFKNGIFQCERLKIAIPGSVLHIHVRVKYYTVIFSNGMKGLHLILTMNFVQDH